MLTEREKKLTELKIVPKTQQMISLISKLSLTNPIKCLPLHQTDLLRSGNTQKRCTVVLVEENLILGRPSFKESS